MPSFGKLAKDFHRCLKSIQSFSNNQAHVLDWDSEHLKWLRIQLRPDEGVYKNGMFDFMIKFGKTYPKDPPNVICLTNIYHPNIDPESCEYNVCLSLLDEWQATFGIEDLIQGLLFLMKNPNLEDPLSPYFDACMDEEEFKDNVRKSMKGEALEDISLNFINILLDSADDEKESETVENSDVQNDEQLVIDKCKSDENVEGHVVLQSDANESGVDVNAEISDISVASDTKKEEQLDVVNTSECNDEVPEQDVILEMEPLLTSNIVEPMSQNSSHEEMTLTEPSQSEMSNECSTVDKDLLRTENGDISDVLAGEFVELHEAGLFEIGLDVFECEFEMNNVSLTIPNHENCSENDEMESEQILRKDDKQLEVIYNSMMSKVENIVANLTEGDFAEASDAEDEEEDEEEYTDEDGDGFDDTEVEDPTALQELDNASYDCTSIHRANHVFNLTHRYNSMFCPDDHITLTLIAYGIYSFFRKVFSR